MRTMGQVTKITIFKQLDFSYDPHEFGEAAGIPRFNALIVIFYSVQLSRAS